MCGGRAAADGGALLRALRAAAAGRVDALRRGAGGDHGQSAAGGGWVAGTRVERGVDACGAAAHRVACGGWSCW